MRARLVAATIGCLAMTTAAVAQEYRWEPVHTIGVQVRVHKKLKPVPVELGSDQSVSSLHTRARLDPESRQQNIMKGTQPFRWGMDVLEFPEAPKYADKTTDPAEVRRRAIEQRKYDAGARDYEHYIKEKLPGSADREFRGAGGKDGVKVEAKRGVPAHTIWEYANPAELEDGLKFHWYTYAAAFELEGREIALAFSWPIFKDEPDKKYLSIAKKMTTALEILESTATEADAKKSEFANSPERKQALETAIVGIRGLDGWDYFTTPEAIVLYSWKPGSNKQAKALKQAEPIAEHFGEIQELFRETFPPPKEMKEVYPIVRICYDRHLLRSYGSPPLHAESFFNPSSGEIVIMLDGKQEPEALAALEGFYQYAHGLFRGAKLSGWFRHGFGHWFAAHSKRGKRWVLTPDKLRIAGDLGAKKLFKSGKQAGLKEFTRMHEDKFIESEDNEDAGKYRSQAYAMVDMLMRGERKLGSKWDDKWSGLVENYFQTLLKTRNASKADKLFDDVDIAAFEDALEKWVKSGLSKK